MLKYSKIGLNTEKFLITIVFLLSELCKKVHVENFNSSKNTYFNKNFLLNFMVQREQQLI